MKRANYVLTLINRTDSECQCTKDKPDMTSSKLPFVVKQCDIKSFKILKTNQLHSI